MRLRNLVVRIASSCRAGLGASIVAALVLSTACTDFSNLPFISGDDGDNGKVSLKIEPAATSVAPGSELPLVISANREDGSPAKDGTVIKLQSDGFGQVVPASTATVGGKANAKFVAGTASGSSTIKAESTGGAKHEVTVKIAPDTPPATAPVGSTKDAISVAEISWGDANVSGWPVTAEVLTLSVTPGSGGKRGKVNMTTTTKNWPQIPYPGSGLGQGNWWIVGKVNGKWHAATIEWLGVGRTSCSLPQQFATPNMGESDRMNGGLHYWVPKKGETVGFFQSTYARGTKRTSNERTNIKTIVWP